MFLCKEFRRFCLPSGGLGSLGCLAPLVSLCLPSCGCSLLAFLAVGGLGHVSGLLVYLSVLFFSSAGSPDCFPAFLVSACLLCLPSCGWLRPGPGLLVLVSLGLPSYEWPRPERACWPLALRPPLKRGSWPNIYPSTSNPQAWTLGPASTQQVWRLAPTLTPQACPSSGMLAVHPSRVDVGPQSTPQAWMLAPNIHSSMLPLAQHPLVERGPTSPQAWMLAQHPSTRCWPNVHPSRVDVGPTCTPQACMLAQRVGPTSTPQVWMLAQHLLLKRGCWPNLHPSSVDVGPASAPQAWMLAPQHPPLKRGRWPNILSSVNVDATSTPQVWTLNIRPLKRRSWPMDLVPTRLKPNIHPKRGCWPRMRVRRLRDSIHGIAVTYMPVM